MKTVALLALAILTGCGQLQSAKVTPAGSGSLANTYTLSAAALTSGCTQLGGAMSADGTLCLVKITAGASIGQNGRIDIDPNFANGKFIVSSGSGVEIVLNGRHVADANSRILANWGNGSLQYNVLNSQQANATAAVYSCYDRNLHSVFCNSGVIPH